ncbi:hypothetical protein [Antarcticirhabdus aurantiaca]|uniref:hypothetical protein n=1 Tax=Antarcticirhabdus aurantiaca TaxID=2606717 RepID=UPI00131CB2B3|nr:hypothetical protein [Antarcticirhabdus aurantiaca]
MPLDPLADHCTLWPDVIGSADLRACCFLHDSMYADQFVSKLEADVDLVRCVAEAAGWPMALLMGAGVILFGLPFWIRAQMKRKR